MTAMTLDEKIAAIRAGLDGAMEGPRSVDQTGYRKSTPTVIMPGGYYVCTTGPYDVQKTPRGQTALHIARLDPDTVRTILDRLAAAEAENKRLLEIVDGYRAACSWIGGDSWDGCSECMSILKAASAYDTPRDMPDENKIAATLAVLRKFNPSFEDNS